MMSKRSETGGGSMDVKTAAIQVLQEAGMPLHANTFKVRGVHP